MKLFRAYSVVDGFAAEDGRSCDGVRVGWYVFDRREPVAPYETLLAGYQGRDAYLESVANELFTGDEVDRLRGYLRGRHGWGLRAQAVRLPVRGLRVGLSGVEPREDRGEEDCLLCAEPGYCLPFLVVGFVELAPGWEVLKDYFDFSAGRVPGPERRGEVATVPARR